LLRFAELLLLASLLLRLLALCLTLRTLRPRLLRALFAHLRAARAVAVPPTPRTVVLTELRLHQHDVTRRSPYVAAEQARRAREQEQRDLRVTTDEAERRQLHGADRR
jgi:hypothetical protein